MSRCITKRGIERGVIANRVDEVLILVNPREEVSNAYRTEIGGQFGIEDLTEHVN